MAPSRTSAERAQTRTPEPPDPDAPPNSPPPVRKSGRTTRQPGSYIQEQERDTEKSKSKPQTRKNSRNKSKSQTDASARYEAITSEDTSTESDSSETTEIVTELIKLRKEIKKRDEAHQEELKRYKSEFDAALATVQQELEDLRNSIVTPQTESRTCTHTSHEEILQELQSLRSAITTPTTISDPSWAAVLAGGNKAQPTPWSALSGARKRQAKETNCIRVSTQGGEVDEDSNNTTTFRKNLPPGVATAQIQKALANAPATQDAQVLGVGITRTGYLIQFRNEDQADTARSNTK